jgi:hypothetical protein
MFLMVYLFIGFVLALIAISDTRLVEIDIIKLIFIMVFFWPLILVLAVRSVYKKATMEKPEEK